MNEDFKQWVWSLAYPEKKCEMIFIWKSTIETLIRAMWAINKRNDGSHITMLKDSFLYDPEKFTNVGVWFPYKDYDNSELKAMKAALLYIYEQEKK
jgi:hypothetical protein